MPDSAASSRNLVFTSAGDNSSIVHWLRGKKDFDLWISYYGESPGRLREFSDHYLVRKGGKFPSLHHTYGKYRSLLDRYDAVLVLDDDLILDADDISALFEIRNRYGLWLLQPGFDPRGKVSHAVTVAHPWTFLRYTNFVEVSCPLFRKDKLDAFMDVYDPSLIGWGVDLWVSETLGPNLEGKVAVIDAITCLNPHDEHKAGYREIDRLQPRERRIEHWRRIREQHNIGMSRDLITQYKPVRLHLTECLSRLAMQTSMRYYAYRAGRGARGMAYRVRRMLRRS